MNKPKIPVKAKCVLSNGLMVLSVKRKEKDIAVITITDFVKESVKLVFDRQAKQLMPNPFSLSLSEKDGKKLDEWLS